MEMRMTGVSDNLAKRFQNVHPFDSREMTPEEQVWRFDQLTPQDMEMRIQTYGAEEVNAFIQRMETMRLNKGMTNVDQPSMGSEIA